MGFGMVSMLLLWALIIVGVVVLVRWMAGSSGKSGSGPHSHSHPRSALDVLKERYARGEIDKQEFEEKKRDLG